MAIRWRRLFMEVPLPGLETVMKFSTNAKCRYFIAALILGLSLSMFFCAVIAAPQQAPLPVLPAESIWIDGREPTASADTISLTRGMQFVQRHRYEQAGKLFQTVKSFELLNYRCTQTVCETFISNGDFDRALQVVDSLRTRERNGEKVSDFLKGITFKLEGDAYSGKGKYELAVQKYRIAAKLKPDSTYPILCRAGEILMKTHKYREAVQTLDQAMVHGCPNGLGYRNQGECYLKLGQAPEAVTALKRSIALIEEYRKKKPDQLTIALMSDYKFLVAAYKLDGKMDLAAAAQKHADSIASGWNDTLFGSAEPPR